MNRKLEDRLKTSLTKEIDAWLERNGENGELPYLGENTAEIMAQAALAVLRGLADAQEYMEASDLLRE